MPEFMYNGLNGAQDSYWSFSSYGTSDSGKWYVCSEGVANNSIFSGSIISGVRPVITVQKSNLKKN